MAVIYSAVMGQFLNAQTHIFSVSFYPVFSTIEISLYRSLVATPLSPVYFPHLKHKALGFLVYITEIARPVKAPELCVEQLEEKNSSWNKPFVSV
jgi:hypothetical protein